MCNVKTQGSLDAQYQGQRTNIPAKMEVLWKDGVKTTILFDGLIDPQETGQAREFTHVGIALVDGKGHFFKRKVNSFRVVCFSFSRLAEDMSDKSIMICQ
jgi:hypothetical protein